MDLDKLSNVAVKTGLKGEELANCLCDERAA